VNKETEQSCDPTARLKDYLQAFSERDMKCVAGCFVGSAVLELPMVRPNRLVGLAEIEAAHDFAFQALSKVVVETNEILPMGNRAITSGRLTVACRGRDEVHPFALVSECAATGLIRVSWYLDSRGYRPWSDEAVL
jgi:hypothetical protein